MMKITMKRIRSDLRSILFVLLFVGGVGGISPSRAFADSPVHEMRLGVLIHDAGVWGGSGREDGTDFNAELQLSPSVQLLGGMLRPILGITLNNSGDTSKIYGGGNLQYIWRNNYFFEFGAGLAAHNGEIDNSEQTDKNLLGSPICFRIVFEAGLTVANHHRLSLMFDHISNGYLADPNEGLDTFGIRYGYLF
jgi:lipid A 3-O-deacylase